MSKAFYLGSFIGATLLIFFIAIIAGVAAVVVPNVQDFQSPAAVAGLILFVLICLAVGVYLVVVTAMLFYKMWDAIRDEGTPVSPVLAVVLLLIPIVNIVWAFLVYPLYAKYYNEYIVRREADVAALRPGLFNAYPILLGVNLVCSSIAQIAQIVPNSTTILIIALPFSIIGMIASIASFVVFLILIVKICDAVNALPITAGGGAIRSAGVR
jgi:hypothetical protein